MWPFRRGARVDHVDARLRAIENQVNALTAAVNSQNHSHALAEIAPIVQAIVQAGLEREKLAIEGRTMARRMAPPRARDGATGRFSRGPAKDQASSCRVCVDPSSPTLTAHEIVWHSIGHPPGGPGAVQLPKYTNGGMD